MIILYRCSVVLVFVYCILQCALCITMDDFFAFGDLAKDTKLERSDDDASSPIALEMDFPFYDVDQRRIFVNNNGLLSFNTPARVFTSQTFPIPSFRRGLSFQLVAPFWGDVDTAVSEMGTVWYRQSNNTFLLQKIKSQISNYPSLYPEVELRNFIPTFSFVATWDRVGYYDRQGDKRNTFQCVLVTDGKISFALFLYPEGEIQWTTGDGSGGSGGLGGTPAQVGFNAGDGIRSLSLALSQTSGVRDIDEQAGNTGEKGLWIFRVDKEIITTGDCSSEGSVTLIPNKGNLLGGSSIVAVGPCFKHFENITCTFQGKYGNIAVPGTSIDDKRALCVVPPIGYSGRLEVQLMAMSDNQTTLFKSAAFFSLSAESSQEVHFANSNLLFTAGSSVTLFWKPEDVFKQVPSNSYSIDISSYALTPSVNGTAVWIKLGTINESIPNLGEAVVNINVTDVSLANQLKDRFLLTFHVSVNEASCLIPMPFLPGIWSNIGFYSKVQPSRSKCIEWIKNSEERLRELHIIDAQPPCPCTLQHARSPSSGVNLDRSTDNFSAFFNPGAHVCGYQLHTGNTDPESLAKRQCCYDSTGYLLPGPPAGGHSALVFENGQHNKPFETFLQHFEKDVIPFLDCCKASDSLCAEYYKFRPSTSGKCAVLPNSTGGIFGDPHFVTFDKFTYTFNGRGEFVLVQTEDSLINIQGRFTEALRPIGGSTAGTVLAAIAVRHELSDVLQFELSRRGVDIFFNGEVLQFETNSLEMVINRALINKDNGAFTVRFYSGLIITVQREIEYNLQVTISLPQRCIGQTSGLLGNFNEDSSDDLIPMGSPGSLPITSSLRDIHEGFGLTWIIGHPSQSLFMYKTFQSFNTFFNPRFSAEFDPVFSSRLLEMQALDLCGELDVFCLFDVAVTESLSVGNTTKSARKLLEQMSQLSQPIICDPPCKNGVCTHTNTCLCQLGYEGSTCDKEVLIDECTSNICNKIGTCRKNGEDTVCICPPYASGFDCESREIFEVKCSSAISDEVLSVHCNSTLSISKILCTVDNQITTPCALSHISINISSVEVAAGNHWLAIILTSFHDEEKHFNISFEVKPVNLTCKGDIKEDHMMINDCRSNNKIVAMECTVNSVPKRPCELPLITDLTTQPPGNYTVNFTVIDVFRLRDAFVLQYTKPSLKVSLINSSPRVYRGSVLSNFEVNRPRGTYSVKCFLTRQGEKNCTQGYMAYVGLPPGTYTLRIVAVCIDGGRHVLRRRVYVDEDKSFCSVHLINTGIEVEGQRVSFHFVASQAVQYLMCNLDGENFTRCRSPYRVDKVSPGSHRIQIVPICSSGRRRHKISETFYT